MQAPTSENPAADAISFVQQSLENSTDPEEREGLASMIEKLQAQAMAPMGEMAQQLAQAGGGEDTMLAHLRPGEIVLPPEMMEDPEFETMVETKFNQLGINPEQAVAGIGIASLNESTGLEQFGFFKKIGKSLKKVVKKVVKPVAQVAWCFGWIRRSCNQRIGKSRTRWPRQCIRKCRQRSC